jgi:hypothetical protein
VFAAGWNDEFIILQRNIEEAQAKAVGFYIVRVKDEAVVGPRTKEEFDEKRKAMGVPTDLNFKIDTSNHGMGLR